MTARNHNKHVPILNILGFAGYMLAALQWLIVLAVTLPALIESPFGELVLPKGEPRPLPDTVVTAPQGPSSALGVFIVTAIGVAIVAGVIYVVTVRYTRAITKTTSEVTHAVTKRAIPVIARKPMDEIAPQKRTVLTRRILFWLKFGLVVLPILLLATIWYPHHNDLSGQLTVFVAAVLALIGIDVFLAQALLAKRWHMRSSDVR